MKLPEAFLEELRASAPIAQVIGRRVKLIRKGGSEWTGLCPFHNEKTPSFTVNDAKAFYHCFGCGAHGDVIAFVMATEGLEFRPAAERLAAEAGLKVPADSPAERARAERNDTLLGAVEFAAKWFEQMLHSSAGRDGLAYLRGRGLDDDTIRRFRLGFAPDSRHRLKQALLKADVRKSLGVEAGLLIKPENDHEIYDRFRNRIMFPILDARGRPIAFGGRLLEGSGASGRPVRAGEHPSAGNPGSAGPKYLNSPETPLFHKGRNLYALNFAREAARESQEIIVVEGYMDVIGLSQAGIGNAVAPLGTALTEDQIKLLWRVAPEPILAFDGDRAGRAAAARAAARAVPLLEPGRSLRFAWMPDGHDPDSLVKAQHIELPTFVGGGADAARAVFAAADHLADVLWRQLTEGRSFDTPERKAGLSKDVSALVQTIADEAVRVAYAEDLRARFDALTRLPADSPRAAPPPPDGPLEDNAWSHADAARIPAAVRLWFQAAPLGRAPVDEWLSAMGCGAAAIGGAPESLRYVGGGQVLAAVHGQQGTVCGVWIVTVDKSGQSMDRTVLHGILDHGAVQLSALDPAAPLYIGVDLVQTLNVMATVRAAGRPGTFWAGIDLPYVAGAAHPDGWRRAGFHPTKWTLPTHKDERRRRMRLPSSEPDMDRPGLVVPAAMTEIVILAPRGNGQDPHVADALLHRAAHRWQREGHRARIVKFPIDMVPPAERVQA